MFAGKIRLKTFMVGVGGLVGIVGGGMLVGMASCADSITPKPSRVIGSTVAPAPIVPRPVPIPHAQPVAPVQPRPTSADHAALILASVGKPLGSSKRKDIAAGASYKVNLYQDDGKTTLNRAKVDLDRDDKWDEKWTLDDGKIQRLIATADDENYNVTKNWSGTAWVTEGEEPPSSAEPKSAPAGVPGMRPVDTVALTYRGKDLRTKKLKDVTKGKPFKINVYQDDGNSTANRVKLDLDRDDKWDEKWTFSAESVERVVAPADDETFSDTYTLGPDGWVQAP